MTPSQLRVELASSMVGLLDVNKKTLASDGISGLYRGFIPSVVGIIVYWVDKSSEDTPAATPEARL
jgi:hypothetical protein